MWSKHKYKILSVFLPIQWIIVQYISSFPEFIEYYYSTGIYPYISAFLRIIFGWIPFSFGDLVYIIGGVFILRFVFKSIKNKKFPILKILSFLSIVYFCFHFFWGFNYFRIPLHKTLKIKEVKYNVDDLETFTIDVVNKLNRIHLKITHNDTVKVVLPYSRKDIYKQAINGYKNLESTYPQFNFKFRSSKNSIISLPMTYLGTSGYLNPFTNEAQVNSMNPLINYPSTTCHEMAHQIGYAAENEANFVGFMTAINNEDIYFKYSGYYLVLRYVLNDLYRQDKELYKQTFSKINIGIVKNMRESQEFWLSYQNPIEPYTKKLFDYFLKVNKQKEGIKSYNLMVGMIINYNKQNPEVLKLLN